MAAYFASVKGKRRADLSPSPPVYKPYDVARKKRALDLKAMQFVNTVRVWSPEAMRKFERPYMTALYRGSEPWYKTMSNPVYRASSDSVAIGQQATKDNSGSIRKLEN
ncbi:hypothetical protein BJ508DRAFT_361692 [Ascobolus immersus RN42]|uniref:Uncharacterized protein n=1 Tax=Ascobolus immersus RN42 TaxID=1160509 RepID=A0A3N4I728_ASCIM|nr:hypothetical protein BJ508DRAFT_361692 [Ascobolus immersus RN42]